ncbi:hypothetical protein ACS0TY_017949 [Phlomoides rotata]
MPEGITAESLMNNIRDTISEGVSKHKNVSFFEEDKSVTSQFNRLFGREKPVHHILGGGKSADVMLWRNKKISASVLTCATIVWVLFEWLNYHFLTLVCFFLVIGLLLQFVWTNASGMLNRGRSSSSVPRVVFPEEVFANIGNMIGSELNRGLCYMQDVACDGNLKHFLAVVGSLFAVAIIGSWCNLLTVIYIGFVGAHTLPILYERYDDQVDAFVMGVFQQFNHNYKKLDSSVLSRIPRMSSFKRRKAE